MARQEPSQASAAQPRGSAGNTGLNPDCLCERQGNFAAALLEPNMPVPVGLVGPDQEPIKKRFDVYRNNVVAGLVEALKAAFPAVCRITGDEFFVAMARVQVALEPPKSPIMLDYGDTFPDFIETFEPAKSVPYLPDVARLERAWVEAYHAAEAPPTDAALLALLATIDSQRLAQLSLKLHPSLRVVRSPFPIVQIWLTNIDGGVPTAIDISSGGENALVVRPFAEVEVRRVPAGAASFILSLSAGATVADATTFALADDSGFDLAGALRDLFAINAIAGWDMKEGFDCKPIARYA